VHAHIAQHCDAEEIMVAHTQVKYSRRQLIMLGVAFVALIAVFVWSQSGPQSSPRGFVSREMMGDAWPLSVDSGILRCLDGRMIVLEANGTTHAVNSLAAGAKTASGDLRWPNIKELSVARADAEGLIKNVQPLVDRGLALCQ
jgi:hypothetical protein